MKTHLVIPELKYEKNLYTAIRTAEAFGCTEVDLIGKHDKDTIKKLSVGGSNHIRIKQFKETRDCMDYLIQNRLHIIAIENSEKAYDAYILIMVARG